ncbi:MAG TPA: SAM-dependent methyltransferase [Methanocorpusculum sp.]|nr:SAM-dependent methyltransferase [Methanocorpusculum sp.]
MKTRIVPKDSIRALKSDAWIDHTRRVFVEGDTAYIPVKEGFPYDVDIPERTPYTGRGYQKMGDTILFHGKPATDEDVEKVLSFEHPSCVLLSRGQTGVLRIPDIEVLYGSPHEVTFRESGISYTLNPSKVMFSQGNRGEKQRIRKLIHPGERTADMFAGIGYFTLSAALAGAEVNAMELNPNSFAYLQKNIQNNGLSSRVHAECGDCRTLLKGEYDRILMGHFDAPDFLEVALKHVKPDTTLHVHGLGDRKEEIKATLTSAGFRYTLSEYKVKKYTNHTWHCVWDVTIE